ncbi:MAG: sulfatase-like hydrolase/transferase [Verrucomicrobiota bacterium]
MALLITSSLTASEKPNILWLTSEDNSVKWLGCYGNPNATTPNIDQFAKEGFRYTNCFANAPVCAPSRSTWITGIHALSMGTQPMRSRYPIPDQIRYYPEYLKKAGYYVSNHSKTDYNIGGNRVDKEVWDKSKGNNADWEIIKTKQPFFTIINDVESHETRAKKFGKSLENSKHDPSKVTLRRYHPDLPIVRKNYAMYQDAVQRMDANFGKKLARLEQAGLSDNTIVIYCSDHGGVLPRSKRFLFDSGIHTPLIIRIPEKYKHLWPNQKLGTTVERLVSFIDMPKTWLSLTGAEIPSEMQGRIFLGKDIEPEQAYHFAFRERMDERFDNVRAVRDKRFLYIKNYAPWAPYGQYLDFMFKMATTEAWAAHHKAGKTDAITGRFFNPKPYSEELYDTENDPDNVTNLANSPEHQTTLQNMRKALRNWQLEIFDSGLIPESERIKRSDDLDTTIYEMVRNRQQYNLPAYLEAADVALANDPGNINKLIGFLNDRDAGIRYWGATGCVMLKENANPAEDALKKCLEDPSHEVRGFAAWSLFNLGEKDLALKALQKMVIEPSYTKLHTLNILDYMGEEAKPVVSALKDFDWSNYEDALDPKYTARMAITLFESHGLEQEIPSFEAIIKSKKKKK